MIDTFVPAFIGSAMIVLIGWGVVALEERRLKARCASHEQFVRKTIERMCDQARLQEAKLRAAIAKSDAEWAARLKSLMGRGAMPAEDAVVPRTNSEAAAADGL